MKNIIIRKRVDFALFFKDVWAELSWTERIFYLFMGLLYITSVAFGAFIAYSSSGLVYAVAVTVILVVLLFLAIIFR